MNAGREVWRWSTPWRTSYAGRPKNVLRPLMFGAGITLRLREDVRPPGAAGEALCELVVRRTPRTCGFVVYVRFNRGRDCPGSGGTSHTAYLHVDVNEHGSPQRVLLAMRQCLNGTGYRMGPRERVLARAAHRVGLRNDRVFKPRPT